MIAVPASSALKRGRSDYVIDNDGDLAALERAARDRVAGAARARLTSLAAPPILPRATTSESGVSNVPDDLLYTAEHEYVARTDDPRS